LSESWSAFVPSDDAARGSRARIGDPVEKRYLKVKSDHLIPDPVGQEFAQVRCSRHVRSQYDAHRALCRDRGLFGQALWMSNAKLNRRRRYSRPAAVAILRNQPVSGLNLYLTSPSMVAVRISVR
jgi:hypothetical protein